MTTDIYITGQMGLYILNLQTERAADWAAKNIDTEDHPETGDSIPVEGIRNVEKIAYGAMKADLILGNERGIMFFDGDSLCVRAA